MRTLLLMRHAKSSWREAKTPDHDRPLNARGERAAPYMGRLLRDRGIGFDRLLTSSAVRALETAKAVAFETRFDGPLDITSRLYLAEPDAYLDALEDFAPSARRVLVVGHNPGLSELVHRLTGFSEELSTAAIAHLEFPIDEWRELRGARTFELADLLRPPKELKDSDEV